MRRIGLCVWASFFFFGLRREDLVDEAVRSGRKEE